MAVKLTKLELKMKKVLCLFLVLGGFAFAQITVDPNSIVIGPESVTVQLELTITAEQYEAMQYKGLTFQDMIKPSRILRYFSQLLADVKRTITEKVLLSELKKLEK